MNIEDIGPISHAYLEQEVRTIDEAFDWTHKLKYGRNSARENYCLIFEERCGTCSTKHAALVKLLEEQGIKGELQMVICKVDRQLVPESQALLEKLGVDYFPGCHCFIHYNHSDVDVTFPGQTPAMKAEILERRTISTEQIGEEKIAFHKSYLKRWIEDNNLPYTLEEVWAAREEWIQQLSQ